MRTAAILPVKRFSHAKQRLGASVADALRADLARAMVGDVLSALDRCSSIELTVVVTNERAVAAAARYMGAVVVEDAPEQGQSAAVALGISEAVAQGAERMLCVPGDCPGLEPAELDALLGRDPAPSGRDPALPGRDSAPSGPDPALPGHDSAPSSRDDAPPSSVHRVDAAIVIVPDRHGTGTNGLLLTPPRAIEPSFGPGSCERHQELARVAGVACRLERPSSLLLDIDTGEDLAVLRERLAGERVRAPRTRAVLGIPVDQHPSRAA
jgi:2-phospho-L-lactate guanylyltransferase